MDKKKQTQETSIHSTIFTENKPGIWQGGSGELAGKIERQKLKKNRRNSYFCT